MASAMLRSLTDAFGKPRKKYSLETFKQLYATLLKYPVIDDTNQVIIIETLRQIAELLIWGDQNEQRFFDFFFEKNIHTHFIKVLDQKTSPTVMVQLLQTLSILFENIRTETSIYFLLSNNYVNTIITHKFDFSDEEILAYYVSFLKTLSLKLNRNTIHFFFNEHLNDFPLYTEAIKFFNHSESMIRVAVRTLTLNVFKVPDERMLRFILDRTAVPYFSNLVWFISDQSNSLNDQIIKVGSSGKMGKLPDLVAEHMDNLYYLNDIFSLRVFAINEVLTAQVLKKLIIPLYVHSLIAPHNLTMIQGAETPTEPRLLPSVALYLLAQVMLIFTHRPIINVLVEILIEENALAYFELMDEFQKDMSEVRISKYAELPPQQTESHLVPLSERGGFTSRSTQSPSASGTVHDATAVATVSDAAKPPPMPTRTPVRPAQTSAQGLSSHTPTGGHGSHSGVALSSHPGSPHSSLSSRSLGPPVDLDGRAGRVTSELFVFVPKPITPSPQPPSDSIAPERDIVALRRSVRNIFRQAIFDHLDASTNDLHALPAICLLHLILKNQAVDPDVLQKASFMPRRLMKSKALLDALVSQGDLSPPIEKGPLTPPVPPKDDEGMLPELPSLQSAYDDPVIMSVSDHEDDQTLSTQRPKLDELNVVPVKTSSSSSSVSAISESTQERDTPIDKMTPIDVNEPRERPLSLVKKSSRPSSVRLDAMENTYNVELVGKVLQRLLPSYGSCRSVTISGAISVVLELVWAKAAAMCLTPAHLQLFRETEELMKVSLLSLLNVFADKFIDIFEDVGRMQRDVDISRLVMDPSVALPPVVFAAPGLELNKRLPTNDNERIRKSILDFLLLRSFRNKLFNQPEVSVVPLVQPSVPIQPNDLLELSQKYHATRCTVVDKEGFRLQRLLIVDDFRLILAESDQNRAGFGVVREVATLPAVLVDIDKRRPTCLDVTVTPTGLNAGSQPNARSARPVPPWSAKIEFEDASACHQARVFVDTAKSSLSSFKIARVREIILSPVPVVKTNSTATAVDGVA